MTRQGTAKKQEKAKSSESLSEYHESKLYFEWAQHHPVLREYLIKNVNEAKRSALAGRYLQLIGMRKGLPDYQLPIANKNWNALWIEMKMKSERFRSKRPEQVEWIQKLKAAKQFATFAHGFEEAVDITKRYLENKI